MFTTLRALVLIAGLGASSGPAAEPTPDLAAAFGAREAAYGMALSPLGTKLSLLTPMGSNGAAVVVVDVATGTSSAVFGSQDNTLRPVACGWKTETRLICTMFGVAMVGTEPRAFLRVVAIDSDGKNAKPLGQRNSNTALRANQYAGSVIDWLPDDPRHVLMEIDVVPEETTGSMLRQKYGGISVQLVDIHNGSKKIVVPPGETIRGFGSDGRGNVRFRQTIAGTSSGYWGAKLNYSMRAPNSKEWLSAGSRSMNANAGLEYDGFDETGNWMYALKPLDGRQALYKVAADGSGASELVFSHPIVDVDGVFRVGKYERAVAVQYTVDALEYEFIDPTLRKLSATLKKTLPGEPDVTVFDETWDQTKRLVVAESNDRPGVYYLYDSTSRGLARLISLRPQLAGMTLGKVEAVKYPAADGTLIPAYLTLPPGVPAKNLRTIILPHGGPSARDVAGFDWLAQYFVKLGYAVLQPNYRGSSGYGETWYRNNGFKSWQTAIGDVNDGARWLVAQGIADPAKLAIVGWSYGGYAALQANVLDPTLYKAAIAIAPVTDLNRLRDDAKRFANYLAVSAFIGEGPHIVAGSPARNAASIRAPVLMFSGDRDLNVDVSQARLMDAALARAGKSHELKIYPGLDHQIDDSTARTDMLRRSADFLALHVK